MGLLGFWCLLFSAGGQFMRLMLEQLEDRTCPTTVEFHGGPILSHPEVNNVFLGTNQPQMIQLTNVLINQYASLLSPFGIGTGILRGNSSFGDPGPISNAQVQQFLRQQILSGSLPYPDSNSLYMVYLPRPTTDMGGAGYHGYFPLYPVIYSPNQEVYVVYAVTYVDPLQSVYVSHEFAEATTDPLGSGWFAGPSPSSYGEIADLYETQPPFYLDGFLVAQFAQPDGSGAYSPQSQMIDLMAIAFLQFEESFYSLLAHFDPAFAGQASSAAKQLQANPLLSTPQGQFYDLFGQLAFESALSGQG
jgi:hypothetical protein